MLVLKENYTPENIISLKENEVFVFGSNVQGEHVGGAALFAVKAFGAVMGQGEGLQGQSYAIPTCVRKDIGEKRVTFPFEKVGYMVEYVRRFFFFARMHKELTFYVTKIGCGIAGFTVEDIAPLFYHCANMDNVYLPKEFYDYYKEMNEKYYSKE